MPEPVYSFVIPVYNEAETLPALEERLLQLFELMDGPTEVVFVDDGSTDGSWHLIEGIVRRDPRFGAVGFSRNFGHQVAITAGLDHAGGEAVVVMDADLQDPPEVVLEMAARWREGFDIVYAVRDERSGETRFKEFTAAAFYRVFRRLTDIEIPIPVNIAT